MKYLLISLVTQIANHYFLITHLEHFLIIFKPCFLMENIIHCTFSTANISLTNKKMSSGEMFF